MRTAGAEVALSGHASGEGLKERVSWLLERLEVAAGRRIGRGMGVLASIGATAPFVGLLGTVWGIMNSFIGISNAHTTNLAVVAPGIAEALLATALGLFAAIPAVVIYNVFARSVAGYRMLIADAGALVLRLVSRDSERGAMRAFARCGVTPLSIRLAREDDDFAETHEINVTPFIDVILVLLIIFMIAAPLATVDVAVDLPASTAEPQQRPDKPIFLTIKGDLSLAVGEDTVPRDALGGVLAVATKGNKDERIFLRADRVGELRRRHGSDEHAAQRRLSEGGAGRAGEPGRQMTARAIVLLQREDDADLKRWASAAAIVLAAHLGLIATYFLVFSHAPAGAPTPAIIIDMAPMPVAPASPVDLAPGPEMQEALPPPEPQVVEPLPPEPIDRTAAAA